MVDLEKLKAKFFTDPDWAMMEELLRSYIDPLESVSNIDAKVSNDELATEVRGRQIAYKALNDFLEQSQVLRPRPITKQASFN